MVWVEELPEGVYELKALTTTALHIDKHKQRLDSLRDHVGLDVGKQHHCWWDGLGYGKAKKILIK